MANVDEVLKTLGLEQQEVQTYLALLDLGESTATKLAERTGLGRVHMYQIMNKLIEKGLASYFIKNNVKYFSAAEPETLLKELQHREESLKKVLPELKARQKLAKQDTKVEVYRGKEGILTVFKMALREKQEYYMLGGGNEACSSEFETIIRIFLKKAEALKMRGYLLEREESTFFIGSHEEYRYLEKEYFSSTTLTLWGNKTVTFVWTRPYYAILIENEEVTRSNLATFKHLWSIAKKPSKEDIQRRLMK